MCVPKISLGLMVTAGVISTSSRRQIFGGLELTGMSLSITRGKANEVYAEAGRQFTVGSRDVLMNAQCPHKSWAFSECRGLERSSWAFFGLPKCASNHPVRL